MSDYDENYIIKRSLTVVVDFLFEKFPEFKNEYVVRCKKYDLMEAMVNCGDNSEEYKRCLADVEYFEKNIKYV